MAIRISGLASGMDTEAMVSDLVKAYKTKGDNYTRNHTKEEWKQEVWKDLNKKIKTFNSKYIANMQYSSYYNKRSTQVSDSSKASVIASDGATTGTQTLEVKELAKTAYLTGNKVAATDAGATLESLGYTGSGKISIEQNGKTVDFDVTKDTKINEVVSFLQSSGYNSNYDTKNQRFFVSSKVSGAEADFKLGGDREALKALGLSLDDGAVKIDGRDAKIKLNGADFTSKSNNFSINGLTINAKNVTSEPISISTDSDYNGVYDSIKSFITDYNSLIKELDTLYNAPANKGYNPLTDQEKEVMSDKEVEKWEAKVKEALLRKDSNLASIANAYKNGMLQTYSINGKSYSLASLGISTGNYFNTSTEERNVLHIDGDADDPVSSGNADRLKAAIAADPEGVTQFFTQLSKNLYQKLDTMSKSSSTRSYGNFYDDKAMIQAVAKSKTKVDSWDKHVTEIEDRYYKQFSKMETMLSKLNSQQSYISNMFAF